MYKRCLWVYLLFFLGGLYSGVTPTYANTIITGMTVLQDTTWTAEASPYIVQGDILIIEGTTLTIEAGVEVRFDDQNRNHLPSFEDAARVWIGVAGTLRIIGADGAPVIFRSVIETPSNNPLDSSSDQYWGGDRGPRWRDRRC